LKTSKQAQQRIENLEIRVGTRMEAVLVWCGKPEHQPDLSIYPKGTKITVIETGVCGGHSPSMCHRKDLPNTL
jgi:hypothetical protein